MFIYRSLQINPGGPTDFSPAALMNANILFQHLSTTLQPWSVKCSTSLNFLNKNGQISRQLSESFQTKASLYNALNQLEAQE